jgi:hypothetical protein
MGMSTNVPLPEGVTPRWPPLCVLCGQNEPDSLFRFRAGRASWGTLLTLFPALGSRPKVEAPACTSCAKRLRLRRWMRELVTWVILIPVIFGAVWLTHLLGWDTGHMRPFRKWIALGIVVVVSTPYWLWAVANPPILDATAMGEKIKYEFADKEYAKLFIEENLSHLMHLLD